MNPLSFIKGMLFSTCLYPQIKNCFTSTGMKKSELRKKYKELRDNLTKEDIDHKSLAIANKLLTLDIWEFSYYHLFLSIISKKEVDTEPILSILQGKDKNVVISKSNFITGGLTNYLLTDNSILKTNKWGIPEPQGGTEIPPHQIEVVFVPLLAFDQQGHRIGYGKGFYDRFLSACSVNTVKVGLSFFEAEPVISEVFESDIPLDYCVTPDNTYKFNTF